MPPGQQWRGVLLPTSLIMPTDAPPELTLARLLATLEIFRAAGPSRAAEVRAIESFLFDVLVELQPTDTQPEGVNHARHV